VLLAHDLWGTAVDGNSHGGRSSRQQTVKQYYIGIGIRDGGVDVLAVWGPGDTAHDQDATLPEICDLSHRAAMDWHRPEIGCASIQKGCC
jgi:hypothetical protein